MQTFDEALAAARHGDEEGWRRLFESVAGRVLGFLRSRGSPDPDGVAGEVMADVVRSIRRFEGSEDQFRSWVLVIAHRRMTDARRARGRDLSTPVDPHDMERAGSDDPEGSVLAMLESDRMRRLLDVLTDDQADVLALRIYGDLSLAETAERLGKPIGAVKALQHRGLAALRRHLDQPPVSP